MSWTQSFDFYIADIPSDEEGVADRRLSILVDLAAAEQGPLVSHPFRVIVRCPLRNAQEDGFAAEEEAPDLEALENRLVSHLGDKGLHYVGRTHGTGLVIFFFYSPVDEDQLSDAVDVAGPYTGTVRVQRDTEWADYFEFLFPDAFALHGIMNRRLTNVLEESGDKLDAARTIEHEAVFPSEANAHAAGVALTGVGFQSDMPHHSDEGVVLPFRSSAAPADIDQVTSQILEVLSFHEGDYMGWGCEKVTE